MINIYKKDKNKLYNSFINIKGFTIVELVIVIAIIAILTSLLIPTFSNIINKANSSKLLENARNKYNLYLSDNIKNINNNDIIVIDNDSCIIFIDGKLYDGIYTINEAKDIMINYYNEFILFEPYIKDNNILIIKENENLIELIEVTDTNQLQSGLDIIIGFKDINNKLYVISNDNIFINNTNYIKSIELENGVLTRLLDPSVFVCKLNKSGNKWEFKGSNNLFLDSSDSNNNISGSLYFREHNVESCNTNYHTWSINMENGETIIEAFLSSDENKFYLQYNKNGEYFGCYPDDNNNLNIYIVKKYK